jgi:hypothetical protein
MASCPRIPVMRMITDEECIGLWDPSQQTKTDGLSAAAEILDGTRSRPAISGSAVPTAASDNPIQAR